jgi:dTDP-glucose pyrophosphorylase/predicted transcriptional regulator
VKNLEDIIVRESTSILEVLKIIDASSKQIAIIVDNEKKLLGTISDGDIRRAILKNISLNDSIKNIYSKTPIVANINNSKEEILNICRSKKIHQIPIIDEKGNLIALEILDELISKEIKLNKVVLMVGGLGTRLRPLTENIPKPMLKVGNKPILQTIVEKFSLYGYKNIVMCVNYKLNIIQDYFGDGSKFGVNIDYILEDKRLGTAGGLGLIDEKLTEPFFVMNADLLTNVNFDHLYDFHVTNNSMATMCVQDYDFKVPYGVVNVENTKILSIKEKPTQKYFVNAGIYMLSPDCLKYIPQNQFYDMPTLFEKLISENENVISFPLREYWLDIGHIDEYEKANEEFDDVF